MLLFQQPRLLLATGAARIFCRLMVSFAAGQVPQLAGALIGSLQGFFFPTPVQAFALVLDGFHDVPISPFLQPLKVSLNGSAY